MKLFCRSVCGWKAVVLERVIGQNNKYEISAFSLARDIYGIYILEENA
jgi:hypothetical protein